MKPRGGVYRDGFTLFELILAVALSATLLALIGTAIHLYLLRVDAGRTRVEEAQLARSILSMIAEDIRTTAAYQPQDTAAIAGLIATASSQTDDDSDDDSDGSGGAGGSSGAGGTGGAGGAATTSGGAFSSTSGGTAGGSSAIDGGDGSLDGKLPLGINGTFTELFVDVAQLPSREELFGTFTGYTNAPMPVNSGGLAAGAAATTTAAIVPPSNLKTVHYFIRQGAQIDPASATSAVLSPELQQSAAGLVRQEIRRAMRTFAEQSGNAALLESGQVLIAPEVVHLEFRYFDGQQVTDVWDLREEGSLPVAVEVRIWLVTPDATEPAEGATYDLASLVNRAREYRQTVWLPMSSASAFPADSVTPQ